MKDGCLDHQRKAIAAGVINPKLVGPRLPGLGKLDSQISQAYGSEILLNLLSAAVVC